MVSGLTEVFCGGEAGGTCEDACGDEESSGAPTPELGVTLDIGSELCVLESLDGALLGHGLSFPYDARLDGVRVDDGSVDGGTHGGGDNIAMLLIGFGVVSFTHGSTEQ